MKKQRLVTALAAILCLSQTLPAQDGIKQFVQERAHAVAYIEPDSVNFTDLEAIGKAIGNSRIVMLGEQDHGDAPAFLAKTRIIKYLHEQKGFDVLAFESNFFGLNFEWERVQQGQLNIDLFLRQNIFGIWTYCDACVPLFYKYIPSTLQTTHPLEITGFDNQIGAGSFFPALDSVLKRSQAPITTRKEYQTEIYPLLSKWYNYLSDSVMTGKCRQYLKEIKQQISDPKDSNGFWPLVIDNQLAFIEQRKSAKDYWKSMNIRDSQMAINLKWLSEVKYAGKKIIVWAHNYHISKYGGHYPEKFLNEAKTMGTCYTSDSAMLNQTYVLGFTSYKGTAGRIPTEPYKFSGPNKKSVESWMNAAYPFAFLNFRDYNAITNQQPESFYMSGSVKTPYHKNHLAVWSKIFDGVFYIREMYPCKKIQ